MTILQMFNAVKRAVTNGCQVTLLCNVELIFHEVYEFPVVHIIKKPTSCLLLKVQWVICVQSINIHMGLCLIYIFFLNLAFIQGSLFARESWPRQHNAATVKELGNVYTSYIETYSYNLHTQPGVLNSVKHTRF